MVFRGARFTTLTLSCASGLFRMNFPWARRPYDCTYRPENCDPTHRMYDFCSSAQPKATSETCCFEVDTTEEKVHSTTEKTNMSALSGAAKRMRLHRGREAAKQCDSLDDILQVAKTIRSSCWSSLFAPEKQPEYELFAKSQVLMMALRWLSTLETEKCQKYMQQYIEVQEVLELHSFPRGAGMSDEDDAFFRCCRWSGFVPVRRETLLLEQLGKEAAPECEGRT